MDKGRQGGEKIETRNEEIRVNKWKERKKEKKRKS